MRLPVDVASVKIGAGNPLVLIAGPCVIESESHTLFMAKQIAAAARRIGMPLIFKASFDKANRSSGASFRGIGVDTGLAVLRKVRALGIPVLTDVHETIHVPKVADAVDCLQIPAFLSRQTDLLEAAGRTGIPVNIKKGQFMAPWDVKHALDKVQGTGNHSVLLTERGTSFGYNNLVVDFRGLVVMKSFDQPIVFDATHSVQLPGSIGSSSGGEPQFIQPLARAAVAVGVDAIFVEVHDDPSSALSDGTSALDLRFLDGFLVQLHEIDAAARRTRVADSN